MYNLIWETFFYKIIACAKKKYPKFQINIKNVIIMKKAISSIPMQYCDFLCHHPWCVFYISYTWHTIYRIFFGILPSLRWPLIFIADVNPQNFQFSSFLLILYFYSFTLDWSGCSTVSSVPWIAVISHSPRQIQAYFKSLGNQ